MQDRYLVWDAVSYAWTEIGLEDPEYRDHAKRIADRFNSWDDVEAVVKDVCGSFSIDSFLIFPCMLWMIMPDWGYSEAYLKERMSKWYSKPFKIHFLNPVRVLGYPVARLLSSKVRKKLKNEYLKQKLA